MSSRSRIRSEPRRLPAAALLLALIAVQCQGTAAAAAPVPLPVAAVIVSGAQTSLVVDLGASTRASRRTVTVTRDGLPQQAQLIPVVSDGLAVALVVDTSTAGAATLPAWLSAGARFILEAPATTQSVVITDSAPATMIAGPQRGPTGVVRALTSVRARGERDTTAALRLAMRQFPDAAAGRRVVVLYTTGADAGGESAGTLAARFRSSGTILVVVGTADGDAYWANAAAATGGFFAPAGDPVVIPALDQVETTLRGRYLVQFPTPPTLPTRVSVRVDTGDLSLTGDAIVAMTPAPAAEPAASDSSRIWAMAVLGLAAAGLLAVVIVTVVRRRRSRLTVGEPVTEPPKQLAAKGPDNPVAKPPDQHVAKPPDQQVAKPPDEPVAESRDKRHVVEPSPSPLVARGRAAVPRPVARGRAIVPGNAPEAARPPE